MPALASSKAGRPLKDLRKRDGEVSKFLSLTHYYQRLCLSFCLLIQVLLHPKVTNCSVPANFSAKLMHRWEFWLNPCIGSGETWLLSILSHLPLLPLRRKPHLQRLFLLEKPHLLLRLLLWIHWIGLWSPLLKTRLQEIGLHTLLDTAGEGSLFSYFYKRTYLCRWRGLIKAWSRSIMHLHHPAIVLQLMCPYHILGHMQQC